MAFSPLIFENTWSASFQRSMHNANKVRELEVKRFSLVYTDHRRMDPDTQGLFLRACLHGGGGPHIGEVTRRG